ncbi:PrpR N-terminal domain-containing protein [Globicatella sulfidifaciens]|uniref:Response regulator containing CheY-like receiver, AAA-type ATPase, and DNA-binding domains n=1 Tax=Globicatella sulfidifaciens DSM 15739 TaxID=1121925 RepID=A0A1T4MW88_9LACT|nr:PrpR N-terminal domain-containing protein [Globicatella sulfidifaciens]SJZ71282.1 Response regulator containing CheY-like receiver, AAA-type ATPase, and DNA-binding domains [Globicatella sulfidifaciens DSM 15739]
MKVNLLIITSDYYLVEKFKHCAKDFHNLKVTILTDKPTKAFQYLEQHQQIFDAILCYGYPLTDIRQYTTLPVFTVENNPFELLRILTTMKQYQDKTLIVGEPSFIELCQDLCQHLNVEYPSIVTKSLTNFQEHMSRSILNQYQYYICSPALYSILKLYSVKQIPYTLDENTIRTRYIEILNIVMPIKQTQLQAHIQNQLTLKLSMKYAVTDQQNRILISEFPKLNSKTLQKQLQNLTKEQPIIDEANNRYQVICNMITWKDSFFNLYQFEKLPLYQSIKHPAIKALTIEELSDQIQNDFFYSTVQEESRNLDINKLIAHYSAIVIYGERYTLKSTMAHLLVSQLSNQLIYQIDCRYIDKPFWMLWPEILKQENIIIILRHVEQLDHAQTQIIISHNKHPSPMITIYELNDNHPKLSSAWNSAYRIHMEPLSGKQENFEEIIDILTLDLNSIHEGIVSTYTTEAMNTLKDYPWPENYGELTNIIKYLVINTKSSVINETEVKFAFNQLLKHPMREDLINKVISYNHPSLEEYIEEIIRYKLEENQGSITETATDLKISRSKIYRYLDKEERNHQK